MRQVGVDLEAHVGATGDRFGEPVAVRRTEPALRRSIDDVDVLELAGEAMREL